MIDHKRRLSIVGDAKFNFLNNYEKYEIADIKATDKNLMKLLTIRPSVKESLSYVTELLSKYDKQVVVLQHAKKRLTHYYKQYEELERDKDILALMNSKRRNKDKQIR